MRGEKQDTLPASMRPLVVFEPVVKHNLLNVLLRVLGKVADLSQLTSERSELRAQYVRPLSLTLFGECQCEIAYAHLPQSHVQKINQPAQANARGSRQRAWQHTENFDERPGCRVLKSLPH